VGSESPRAIRPLSPHLYAHRIKTPTLTITNELDFRVPADLSRRPNYFSLNCFMMDSLSASALSNRFSPN